MIAILGTLLRLYFRRHVRLSTGDLPLTGPGGDRCGHVDRITVTGGRIVVEGWARAVRVTVTGPDCGREAMPDMPRPDAAAMLDLPDTTPLGFRISLPWLSGRYAIALAFPDGSRSERVFPSFGRLARLRAHGALIAPFFRAAFRVAPHALRWTLSRDVRAKEAILLALDLRDREPAGWVDPAWLLGPPASHPAKGPISIIVPVHGAFDLLRECLDRVVRHTDLPFHLIVVEDRSPDARIRPWLRAWASRQSPRRVTLIENTVNLGFVGAVNRGLARAASHPGNVVLLNTDALVPPRWASRLVAPLTDRRIASVTPMSNDAEIFSVPRIGRARALQPGEAERIDARAATLRGPPIPVEAPTGVGFCMALSRHWLARAPRLDAAFGRGYGEEVDWCQRTRRMGARHVAQPGLFVEHRGGQSFGSAAKRAAIARAGALIARRYPRYDAEVQAFIAADPLATVRLALALALRPTGCPLTILVGHSMGGGAEACLRTELSDVIARDGCAVVLRLGGPRRFRVERHDAQGSVSGETDDPRVVEALLSPAASRHIVYSCGVGDRDPVTLPGLLLSLAGTRGRVTVLMNDFLPLSPSFNLLDSDEHFRGVPGTGTRDPAHLALRPGGGRVPLSQWRREWGRLIAAADEVRVFARSGAHLVTAAYPEAADRIVLRPHAMRRPVPRLIRRPGPEVIGILGNIGPAKGAAAVAALSFAVASRGGPGLVLLGELAPGYTTAPTLVRHGGYALEDLAALAGRYGVTRWLIPSICPETFSFTTHEALATGLPTHVFDLGAQAEALRDAGRSDAILDLSKGPDDWLVAMLRHRPNPRAADRGADPQRSSNAR